VSPDLADEYYICDYHLHSTHSFDARNSIKEVCSAAIGQGIHEIGFAEHVGIDPADEAFGALNYVRYRKDIMEARKNCAGKLKIRLGVEIDFRPGTTAEIEGYLKKHDFDFVIGALHYLDDEILLRTDIFEKHPAHTIWSRYFDELLLMVSTGLFDIIAHLDVPKRGHVPLHGPFNWKQYEKQIRSILAEIIKYEAALEINTAGLRKQAGEIFPSPGIINLYRQLGGRYITIGSDAHSAPSVGCDFDIAIQAAESAGFTHMTTFSARKKKLVPIRIRGGH
jgi:histidinol-phosphatase (PHP family)